jgi:hypothetical protein
VPVGKLKEKKMKKIFFLHPKNECRNESDQELDPKPEPDPLVRTTDRESGSAPKCHGSPTLIEGMAMPPVQLRYIRVVYLPEYLTSTIVPQTFGP